MTEEAQFEARIRRRADALRYSHGDTYATKWLAAVRTLRERWVLYHVLSTATLNKQKPFKGY